MNDVNEKQVSGTHYKVQGIQHWDYVLTNDVPYMEAQVLKYVSRHRLKGGADDLRKAQHFIEKLVAWESEYPHVKRDEEPEERAPTFTDWVRSCDGPEFSLAPEEIVCMHQIRFWRKEHGDARLRTALALLIRMIAELDDAAEPQRNYIDQD